MADVSTNTHVKETREEWGWIIKGQKEKDEGMNRQRDTQTD